MIALAASSKNLSNPPGVQTRISLASLEEVFAQRWGISRGAKIVAPCGIEYFSPPTSREIFLITHSTFRLPDGVCAGEARTSAALSAP